MNEQYQISENFIVITLIIALLADLFFRLAWNKIYFTVGLPIFVLRIPVVTRYKGIPFQYLFEEEFRNNSPWRSFLFSKIEDRKIGFREQFLEIRYSYVPLMHGLLIFENDKKQVVVKGFANWFTIWLIINLALAGFGISGFFQLHVTSSIAFIFLLSAVFYALQCYRFSKVGKFAAEMCSNKHFLKSDGV